ncbi:MAG TPA: hypothetical protein VIL78_16025 [Hanamia sp.]
MKALPRILEAFFYWLIVLAILVPMCVIDLLVLIAFWHHQKL